MMHHTSNPVTSHESGYWLYPSSVSPCCPGYISAVWLCLSVFTTAARAAGGGRMRRVGAAEHRQVEGGGAALGRGSGAGELGLTRLLLRPLRQSAVRSYNDPGS